VRPEIMESVLNAFESARAAIAEGEGWQASPRWGEMLASVGEEGQKCWFYWQLGEALNRQRKSLADAVEAFESALEIPCGSRFAFVVQRALGQAYEFAGLFAPAEEAYRVAWGLAERDRSMELALAVALQDLAVLARRQGWLDQAEAYLLQALQLRRRQAPGSAAVAGTLSQLGRVAKDRGDLESTMGLLTRAQEILEAAGTGGFELAEVLELLGQAEHSRGDAEAAERFLTRALLVCRAAGPRGLLQAAILNDLGLVARSRGDRDQAQRALQDALGIVRSQPSNENLEGEVLANLGSLAEELGKAKEARAHLLQAVNVLQRLAPGSNRLAIALNGLGDLAFEASDLSQAFEHHGAALDIQIRLTADDSLAAESLFKRGRVCRALGFLSRAKELFLRCLASVEAGLRNAGGRQESRPDLTPDSLCYPWLCGRRNSLYFRPCHDAASSRGGRAGERTTSGLGNL